MRHQQSHAKIASPQQQSILGQQKSTIVTPPMQLTSQRQEFSATATKSVTETRSHQIHSELLAGESEVDLKLRLNFTHSNRIPSQ